MNQDCDDEFQEQLINATHIDRLNLGPSGGEVRGADFSNWAGLQPHERNIVEFLFRPRAFQARLEKVAV